MTDRIDNLESRLGRVEDKVDALATSVAEVAAGMERGFGDVSVAMECRFRDVDIAMERRFRDVDIAIDEQRQFTEFVFARLEAKVDAGFASVDENASRLEAKLDSGFARIERKLDQFINVQLQTNQQVDRRLRAIES